MKNGVVGKIFHNPKQSVRANYTAVSNPTVTEDASKGYGQGSEYYNTLTTEMYRCADAAIGAAVWINTTLTIDDLATVALSGDYNDLSGTPTLATVALSGSYADLSDIPVFANVATSGVYNDLIGKLVFADVAFSGSYDDLTGNPVNFGADGEIPIMSSGDFSYGKLHMSNHTLTLQSTDNADASIYIKAKASAQNAELHLGYDGAAGVGRIVYDNTNKKMEFWVDGGLTAQVNDGDYSWDLLGHEIRAGKGTFSGDITAKKGSLSKSDAAALLVERTTSSGTIFSIQQSGTSIFQIFSTNVSAASSDVLLRAVSAGTGILRLQTNGPNDALVLDASQNAKFSSLATGTVYSNAGTLTNTNPSDKRLKDIHGGLEYGLKELKQLTPKWYNFKGEEALKLGYIAQDVMPIMPKLVTTFKMDVDGKSVERMGLDIEGVNVVVVRAIQELTAIVENQQDQINQLKSA